MSRPAALVLTPRPPWPPDDGGRIVAWQNLLAVADEYDTTLVTFAPLVVNLAPPPELTRRGVRVVFVHFAPPPAWVAAIAGLFGRWPYSLARYRSREFERAVRGEIARRRPAFAYAHHLHLATYVDALDGVPLVLREHNVEFRWMERYARSRGATPRGLYARLQSARLLAAESALCRRAALVLAIQDEETRALRAIAPGARVETLPVGADLASVPPRSPAQPPVVLLAASFLWPPNVEGAIRFLREGWPRLRAQAPEAVLRVAGKGPPFRLRDEAAKAGAQFAPDVPSMADEYARAALLIVPLWVGAGARVKMVEALAARLPVVATTPAAEGLGLTPGVHFVAAETPEAIADEAAALLHDAARRETIGAAGRAHAERHWSVEAVAALQSRLLASVSGAKREVAPPGAPG